MKKNTTNTVAPRQINLSSIPVEVGVSPLWNNKHELIGYFPAIFGPNTFGDTRTYWVPALCTLLMGDPRTFVTPEAAMAAWEKGEPWEVADPKDHQAPSKARYTMPEALRLEINSRQLLRR